MLDGVYNTLKLLVMTISAFLASTFPNLPTEIMDYVVGRFLSALR